MSPPARRDNKVLTRSATSKEAVWPMFIAIRDFQPDAETDTEKPQPPLGGMGKLPALPAAPWICASPGCLSLPCDEGRILNEELTLQNERNF